VEDNDICCGFLSEVFLITENEFIDALQYYKKEFQDVFNRELSKTMSHYDGSVPYMFVSSIIKETRKVICSQLSENECPEYKTFGCENLEKDGDIISEMIFGE